MSTLLIRYNELGLKSPRVRSRFQKQLIKNIEDKFFRAGLDGIIDSDWGRIYLNTDSDDHDEEIRLLTTVFGISSISPVITTSDRIEEITKIVIDHAKELISPGQSFALRTRRTGKHSYTSMELAKVLGSDVLDSFKNKNIKVDLSSPDVEIFIEVRHDQAFVFSESYEGPGGLPLGTQGKVLSIITGPQAYIASWLMMKRGCRVYPVFFRNKDNSSGIVEGHAKRQIEMLKAWVPNIGLRVIDLDEESEEYLTLGGLNDKELLNFARWAKAKGVCLSINFKEFSKLSEQLKAQTNTLPVFYPLIGLDAEEIQRLGRKIKEKST